ncbi:MAG: hypothetical protein JSR82_05710 [Verrucomicrobia bacterium]|nr:hypothetical protein [Verrucomicrobiota bacterium]
MGAGRGGWPALAQLPTEDLARLLARTPFASFDPTLPFAFRRLAQLDPARALTLAATRGGRDTTAMRAVFSVLSASGREAVQTLLAAAEPNAREALAVCWVDALLGAGDPKAALEFALQSKVADLRLDAVFSQFAAASMTDALEQAWRLPSAHHRTQAIGGALRRAQGPAAAEAARWIQVHPALPDRERLLQIVFREFIVSQPRAAVEAIGATEPRRLSTRLFSGAMEWCPAGALPEIRGWMDSLPAEARSSYLPTFFQAWAKREPVAALTESLRQPPGELGLRLVWIAAATMAARDPAAVEATALSQPPTPARALLVRALMSNLNSAAALKDRLALLSRLPNSTSQEWAELDPRLRSWARQAPESALESIRMLAPSAQRQRLERLVESSRSAKR